MHVRSLQLLSQGSVASRLGWAAMGLFVGVVLSISVARWERTPQPLPVVQAMTSQANDSFAVCTAPMTSGLGGGVEGFFMLDFLTGDLSGGLLNPATGTFGVAYRHNVLDDLGFQQGQAKEPMFLLVAGRAELRRRGAPALAPSVLYVTDCSSGATVAYGIPVGPQQGAAVGIPQPLLPLDIAQPRGGGLP